MELILSVRRWILWALRRGLRTLFFTFVIAPSLRASPYAPAQDSFSTAHAPFIHFESATVEPIAVSADGRLLLVLNTPDHRLEVFSIRERQVPGPPRSASPGRREFSLSFEAAVLCGLEPVSIALHPEDTNVVFVSNQLSDTVSVVALDRLQVAATLNAGDEPSGLAVTCGRLFVACARAPEQPTLPGKADPGPYQNHVVTVFEAAPPYGFLGDVVLPAVRPRDVVAAGDRVYVTALHSGNHTTLLDEKLTQSLSMTQLTRDSFDPDFAVNGVVVRPDFKDPDWIWGWILPKAGRIVFDHEYKDLVPQLEDNDVLVIDAPSLQLLPETVHGAGTTLLDLERSANGDLWIAGTDARNRTRFEPFLRGDAVENRLTVVVSGSVQRTIDLGSAQFPEPLAQPVNVALYDGQRGDLVYVAAHSSARVGVVDAVSGAFLDALEVDSLPVGLAVDAGRDLLFVLCRGSDSIHVFDIRDRHRRAALPVTLSYRPEPQHVRAGREHLYDARVETGAGNGTMSCASCHIFGHFDQLGWDLGDPEGSFSYYFPDVMTGFKGYPYAVVTDPKTPILHPMKGPMVTQSLRGLIDPVFKDEVPLHWRGDRRVFQQFRGAFEGLLGGSGKSRLEIQQFAAFLRDLEFPPNPLEPRDRVYRGDAEQGRIKYGLEPAQTGREYVANTGVFCVTCHHADFTGVPRDYSGSRQTVSAGSFTQIFNTSQLRHVYEKDFFTMSGFGALHDGAVDGVRGFMDFVKPNGGPVFPNFSDDDKDHVATFVKAFDSGTAPLVGVQVSATAANVADAHAFMNLAEARAQAEPHELDLILKGDRISTDGSRERRGAVFTQDASSGQWGYQFDTGAFADRVTVELVIALGAAEFTFTCVPPGMGWRLGVDRDEDDLLDFIEQTLGTDESDPDTDGDGYADGAEGVLGGDPTRAEGWLPDFDPPAVDALSAREIAVDVATISVRTSEPASLSIVLGTAAGEWTLGPYTSTVLKRIHEVIALDLPAGADLHCEVTATDRNGNSASSTTGFRTLPPFLHVEDIEIEKAGAGPYEVSARVKVFDHSDKAVAGVPVMGFWAGDMGGQDWQQTVRTDSAGVATFALAPFTPSGPTRIFFSPAYIGTTNSADPYFVGIGGFTPSFFYDQTRNRVHYRAVDLP